MVQPPLEVEVNGRKFKIGKIDVLKQFHVARKMAPMLSEAIPAMQKMKSLQTSGDLENISEEQKLEAVGAVLTPFINGVGKLSDADAELVLFSLLACCEVYQEQFKTWARVSNDKVLMIQDLGLPVMLQAAGQSFMHNISGFF